MVSKSALAPLSPSEKESFQKFLLLQGQMLIAQVFDLTVEFAVARDTSAGVPAKKFINIFMGHVFVLVIFSK